MYLFLTKAMEIRTFHLTTSWSKGVIFLTKTTEIKIHFKHYVGKYGPDTEFDRNFCAGIGPLHLGVVLVYRYVNFEILNAFCFKICDDLEGKLCKQWR